MTDVFKNFILKNFSEFNHTVSNKFSNLDSKELEKMISNIIKNDEVLNEIDQVSIFISYMFMYYISFLIIYSLII